MMKWEYMYVNFSFNDKFNKVYDYGKKCYSIIGSVEFLIEKLDGFGAMGWESSGSPCIISEKDMLFKRPI